MNYIKRMFVIVALLISLATLFPPFHLGDVTQWGFFFSPPLYHSDFFNNPMVNEARIDWSILRLEYIIALAISVVITYFWGVVQDRKRK